MANVKILKATNGTMLGIQTELSAKDILTAKALNPALLTVVDKDSKAPKFKVSIECEGSASKYGVEFEVENPDDKLSLFVPSYEHVEEATKATAYSIKTNLAIVETQVQAALAEINAIEIEVEDFSVATATEEQE